MNHKCKAAEGRRTRIASAYCFAEMAFRIAGIEAPRDRAELAKHVKTSDGQEDWVPAAGGREKPFLTRDGKRLQYVWQPSTGKHAYYDLDNDLILSEEESRAILGSSRLKSPSSPKGDIPLTDEQESGAYDAGYEAASYLRTSGKWSGDVDSVFLWVMENDSRVPSVTEDDPSFWEWHEAVRNGITDYGRSNEMDLK